MKHYLKGKMEAITEIVSRGWFGNNKIALFCQTIEGKTFSVDAEFLNEDKEVSLLALHLQINNLVKEKKVVHIDLRYPTNPETGEGHSFFKII